MSNATAQAKSKTNASKPKRQASPNGVRSPSTAVKGTESALEAAKPTSSRNRTRSADKTNRASQKEDHARTTSNAPSIKEDSKSRPPSKNSLLIVALGKKGGATIEDLCTVSGWQSHSVRAAMTGLKKKGYVISRTRTDGKSVYAITAAPTASDGQSITGSKSSTKPAEEKTSTKSPKNGSPAASTISAVKGEPYTAAAKPSEASA
ncbi:MAG: DUF3489 domain-containing protein [Hyphomicrobiaceae bacterium]|nr:DUF3489 domain-containing protein [Hyphomicrobiaceae bacterium]